MSFVDRVEVTFQAGNGGDGIVSFRHEKFRPLGGPDGGDGGDGGSIVLLASNRENTLSSFRFKKLIKAENGHNGVSSRKHGKNAVDTELSVPVGTVVLADGEVLADLSEEGQSAVIAKGGKGGFGNAHFVSSTRQAPRIAENGEKGEKVDVTLELKMIADVGIVGLPNAGKSTLLSVISNARPQIADYPFTTLVPNLGVVDFDEHSILFADIPGLIEGASQGKGLGDEFLRHIERTKVLVHLIDVYSEDLASDYKVINKELADYKIDLSDRPQIVALTKIDGFDEKELAKKISLLQKSLPKNSDVFAISSQSGKGVKELLRAIGAKVKSVKSELQQEPSLPVIGIGDVQKNWNIEKQDETFIITGRKIEKFAERTKFGDYHGEQRLRDIMQKMGIMHELKKLGAMPDQKIQIGQPKIGQIEF